MKFGSLSSLSSDPSPGPTLGPAPVLIRLFFAWSLVLMAISSSGANPWKSGAGSWESGIGPWKSEAGPWSNESRPMYSDSSPQKSETGPHKESRPSRFSVSFRAGDTYLEIREESSWRPIFLKGVNMGIAVPGTTPLDMKAAPEDYLRWFRIIQEAGFNSIRILTRYPPEFYRALDHFNRRHPEKPLYLFQGIWLEEELPGYDGNLFFLTGSFDREIRENIRAIHGDINLPKRPDKSWGRYDTDVSAWVAGYIIGREIHPEEVRITNRECPECTSYEGRYLSIDRTRATEFWLTGRLDELLRFEMDQYGTQRPVSFSSWPTLDPLDHPEERNERETMEKIDLANLDVSRAPAGYFASYHVYPYYPEYISCDPRYDQGNDRGIGHSNDRGIGHSNDRGGDPGIDRKQRDHEPHPVLPYLTRLKSHYPRFPLVIGEFGASTGWAEVHRSCQGTRYGGYTESEQGDEIARQFEALARSGTGGGMLFSFMDEWFKTTWLTDPLDPSIHRRKLWHNVTSPEQNFGIIGFRSAPREWVSWQRFDPDDRVTGLDAVADNAFFRMRLHVAFPPGETDTLWISMDTYRSDLGESLLPDGRSVENRADFALMITGHSAQLFVAAPANVFDEVTAEAPFRPGARSGVSDKGDWQPVRWFVAGPGAEFQEMGALRVKRPGERPDTRDGVRLYDDRVEIRLPWNLLNVTDPGRARVVHDRPDRPGIQSVRTDGIHVGLFWSEFGVETKNRFTWPHWNRVENVEEYKKDSYDIIRTRLPYLNPHRVD